MTPSYIALFSLIVSVLGLMTVYFGFIVRIKEDIAALKARCESRCSILDCIPRIQTDIATLSANSEWTMNMLRPALAASVAVIHSPIHRRRDTLVDGLMAGTLTLEELREVHGLLREMLTELNGEAAAKRLAGGLLLGLAEAQLNKAGVDARAQRRDTCTS